MCDCSESLEKRIREIEVALADTMKLLMLHIHPPIGPAKATQEVFKPFDRSYEIIWDRVDNHSQEG